MNGVVMKIMKERVEIFKIIFPYVSKFKIQWILLLCLKVGQRFSILVQPLILRAFIVNVIDARKMSYILIILAMYIGLYFFDTILKVCHRVIDNSLFNKITKELRTILFERYMYMPIEKYNTYEINDLVRRVNFDIDMVKFFLVGEVFDYISYIVSIIVSTVLMLFLDWHLVLIAYFLLPFSIVLSKRYEDKIEKNAEQNRKLVGKIENCVEKITLYWKEIKANQFEIRQEKIFGHILEEYLNCMHENTEINFCRKSVLAIKESIVDLLVIYVSAGIISLFYHVAAGTVIACVEYYNNILGGLREIMEIDASLNWIKPSIYRVIEILNFPCEKYDKVLNIDNGLTFDVKNLCFRYDNSGSDIIKDLSFEIKESDKILLEGVSGSGKSTMIQILTGELIPTEGEVFFKGLNLPKFSKRELYNYIRIIDQNTYYMNVTVKEFLKMAKPGASDTEIKQACKLVNLWEDLQTKTEGLEVYIGENGSKFSKGQKQKLALARVLLSQNKTIILDEAFSAIDAHEKTVIIDRLLKRFKEETVICVTHDEEIKKHFYKTINVGKYKY